MRKPVKLLAVVWCLLCVLQTNAQNSTPVADLSVHNLKSFLQSPQSFERYRADDLYYLQLHFEQLPGKEEKALLEQMGIQLIQYNQNGHYLAALPTGLQPSALDRLQIDGIVKPDSFDKLSQEFFSEQVSSLLEKGGDLDLALVFSPTASDAQINDLLSKYALRPSEESMAGAPLRMVRLPSDLLDDLVNEPLIVSLDVKHEEPGPLNREVCVQQRVNVLHSSLSGERNLDGSGVVIGVGDGGQLGDHLDFGCRIFNEADGSYSSFGQHGDHVAGIIGGGGLMNPRHRGMAPGSNLLIQKTSLITFYTEDYHRDYQMVLTNNSYGTSFNCNSNGTYNYTSLTLDWQLNQFSNLLHVFAAGNSGRSTCASYPKGYKTVLRYYQSAKNVLTVGAVSETRSIWSSSSRGPVSDGRIKPEICGIGTKVYSTGRDYNYWAANGTSMAAPAVTGTLGLLYQRYRQLHNGDDPDGAFLKALVCNTADDLGNSGPDYTYGFGLINGRRAVEVMENLQYAKGEIEQGQVDQLSINVPAGVSEVKVMLYWSDKEAAAFPTKALVNDLDLSVQQPGGTVYFPWVLNPDTLHVEDVARRGVDNLNNIEQVTIETPTAGQYEIFVNGREIPFGPQAYYIVYDFIRPEITLTHPIGGEKWIPGTKELIQWDADDGVGQTYKIEYSADNGQNWATIVDNISHTTRFYEWTVPSLESSDVQLRVSRNGTALSASTKANFEIHSLPTNLTTTSYCNGLVEVGWTGTTEATDYEVLFYNGCDWEVVQSTNLTTALVDHNLQDNQEYWFTVRAVRGDGRAGERAQAVKCMVDPNALCPWGVAPNFNAFTIPDRGRSGTSSSLDLVKLFGEVRNVGQDTVFQYGFFFSVNGNTPVENTIQDTLLPGVTKTVDLGASIDFSATGVYSLEAWTRVEVDGLVYIDSLDTPHQVVQLPNPPIAFPYTLDLTQGQGSYQNDRIGLDGLDNVDFKTQGIGQLNFVNGSMSLASLEDDSQVAMDNEIILTMNVGNIPSNDERHVLINFRFASALDINTPLSNSLSDTIWARGQDTDEWLFVMALDGSTDWTEISGLDITAVIEEAGQAHSTSTQVRFHQRSNRGLILNSVNAVFNAPLPVELGLFELQKFPGQVMLHWQTNSEINSDYFEVELAVEDQHGAIEDYQSLGRVQAVGNTVDTQDYYFLDKDISSGGNRYYRLKMVDRDGSYEYSPVKVARFEKIVSKSRIFPNPFSGELYFQSGELPSGPLQVELWSIDGAILSTHQIDYQQGQTIELPSSDASLPPGAYMLHLIGEQHREQFKILKQ